jgi:hypothetical protein
MNPPRAVHAGTRVHRASSQRSREGSRDATREPVRGWGGAVPLPSHATHEDGAAGPPGLPHQPHQHRPDAPQLLLLLGSPRQVHQIEGGAGFAGAGVGDLGPSGEARCGESPSRRRGTVGWFRWASSLCPVMTGSGKRLTARQVRRHWLRHPPPAPHRRGPGPARAASQRLRGCTPSPPRTLDWHHQELVTPR